MKKALLLLLALLLMFPLFSSVQAGYSFSVTGEHSPLDDNFGALSLSFNFSPWADTHVGDMEAEVLLSPVSPFFNGARIKLSSPLMLLMKHPFAFMFPNTVYWAPRLTFGCEYRMQNEWNLYLSLAPFSFQDTGYIYEFLSPYALYNIQENKWGYGAYIMRFTVFLGGNA